MNRRLNIFLNNLEHATNGVNHVISYAVENGRVKIFKNDKFLLNKIEKLIKLGFFIEIENKIKAQDVFGCDNIDFDKFIYLIVTDVCIVWHLAEKIKKEAIKKVEKEKDKEKRILIKKIVENVFLNCGEDWLFLLNEYDD